MTEYQRRRDEKQEKNEKDEGDSWDEKWRNDPVNAAVWALILIWAGVVLLLSNLDVFDMGDLDAVSIGFVGAGLIMLGGVAVRLVVPAYHRPVFGSVILGLIFIGIGLGNLISWNLILPLILIAIGIAGLLAYFRTRR